MEENKTNAQRFILAYNTIDQSLRSIYNFSRSINFSELIRRCVVLNSVVRKYEDDLIDYGRLRNAIIHNSSSNFIIAEPHDITVNNMEKIAEIIATPPLALDRISNKEVLTLKGENNIKDAIELIVRSGYSNIPVYSNDSLIGIANGRKLLNSIGEISMKNEDIDNYIKNTKLESIFGEISQDRYFAIADENLTIESAMHMFETNRKLMVILITSKGKYNSLPKGIITITDVVEMQKILNVY